MALSRRLARAALEGLSEEENLELIIDGQDTSSGHTTENVGTGTLEEGHNTFLLDDLGACIERALVLDGLTGSHHHTTTNSVERVGCNTSTGGDTPTEEEGGQEVVLEGSGQDDGLDRVVHTEVKTTVHNDTRHRGHETTIEAGNTVRGKGLPVDVDETVKLTLTTPLGGLGVVGKTGTGIVKGIDEKEGSGTSSTTGGKVTRHPLGVAILILLVAEHLLELITEGKVQGLGGEVTDDIGRVTSPEGQDALVCGGPPKAIHNAIVFPVKTASLEHLILILNEKLDTLDRGSSGLGDSSRNTTHEEIDHKGGHPHDGLLLCCLGHFDGCLVQKKKRKDGVERNSSLRE